MSMKLDAENAILWAKLKKYRQFILFNYFLSLYDFTIKLKVLLKKLWKSSRNIISNLLFAKIHMQKHMDFCFLSNIQRISLHI